MTRAMRLFALLAVMACLAALPVLAEEEAAAPPDCYAYLAGIAGTVEFQAADAEDKEAWQAGELNKCLNQGDRVRTLAESGAAIKYGKGVEMKLNAETTVTVKQNEGAENPDSIDMDMGELFTTLDKEIMGDGAEFKVGTPSGVVAVRGTEFNVAVDKEGKAKVNVLDGVVAIINDLGEVLAEAGFAVDLLQGVQLELLEFDIGEFKKNLDAWKDQISVGAVKEKLMNQLNEQKDKLKEKIPGKGKLGF